MVHKSYDKYNTLTNKKPFDPYLTSIWPCLTPNYAPKEKSDSMNYLNYFWNTKIHLSKIFHECMYHQSKDKYDLHTKISKKGRSTLKIDLYSTPNLAPKETSKFQCTTKIASGTLKYIILEIFINIGTISSIISTIHKQK